MSLLQYSIKNMIGGVSQQPASVRLQNQCEEMINCVPSVTDFLKRRPGTHSIAKLLQSLPDNAFIDLIIRGENEAGLLIVKEGEASVYDLRGTLIGRSFSSYFNTDNPKEKLRLLTIKDYNFILNTDISVNGKSSSYTETDGGFVFIKQAAYDTVYKLKVNGREYSYTTPKNDSNGMYRLSTDLIAARLAEKIIKGVSGAAQGIYLCKDDNGGEFFEYNHPVAPERCPQALLKNGISTTCNSTFKLIKYIDGNGTYHVASAIQDTNVSVIFYRNIIRIRNRNGSSPKVESYDGMSNSYMQWIEKKVQSFTELPLRAPNGYIIEIIGDPSNRADNYYVKFKTDDGSSIGDGSWLETSENGVSYSFDTLTMPHAITVYPNRIETITPQWKPRNVGNDISCPLPSFINSKIKDIFFYRNRLCFLTENSVCMSEVGEYFNFFNTTATTMLDSDPIDVSVSGTKVSRLKYALPYNEGLFIYSDTVLFVAEHGEILSTSSISIRPHNQFDTDISARPVVMDTDIFYITSRGDYTSVREYSSDISGNMYGSSKDITSHIPRYIPKGITKIASCVEEGVLFAITGKSNIIYVYNFYNDSGRARLQSAWGKWVFACTAVRHIEVIKGTLYIVTQYEDGLYLEKLVLGENYGILKDRQGLAGKETDYESSYTYSNQYIRWDPSAPTVTGGRVQLRTLFVKYAESGPFQVIINRTGRKAEEREVKTFGSGELRALILAKNEDVKIMIKSIGSNQFKLVESRLEAVFATRSKII